ncbi:MAG: hypothetical protein M3388_00865 [Acidobacteriota bacterium]|nr:hypothetical protein [Acidobacteriota bacterium]
MCPLFLDHLTRREFSLGSPSITIAMIFFSAMVSFSLTGASVSSITGSK